MSDFIDWLKEEAPEWVHATVVFMGYIISVTSGFLSLVALVEGYWIIPLLVWVVLPAYLVIRAYLKDRANDT